MSVHRGRSTLVPDTPPAATSPPPAAPIRNQSVEVLRIVAAFGIVWYHSTYPVGHFVAYAGLIVFAALSAYFESVAPHRHSYGTTARRMLVPWLAWSLVFGAMDVLQRQPVFDSPLPLALLVGTSPHLWYLPFITFCIVVIRFTKGRVAIPALFALGLSILLAGAWRMATLSAPPPLSQWGHLLPAVCFGVLLARTGRGWTLLSGACLGAMFTAWNIEGIGMTYLLGCGSVCLVLIATPRLALPNVAPISTLMFGVYLIHPALLSIGRKLHLVGPALVVFAFVVAAAATWAIRLTRVGRAIS